MTERRGPGRDFSDLREFGKSALNTVLDHIGRGSAKMQERKPLPHDLLESDDAYLVVFDAPGATSSDVTVHFLDGEVQVRIDRFRKYYEDYEMRFPGRGLSLDGRVELPRDAVVDPDQASATLSENGSLHVRVPKSGDSHEIQVQEADEEPHEAGAGVERDAPALDVEPADEPAETEGDADGVTGPEPEIGSADGNSDDTDRSPPTDDAGR